MKKLLTLILSVFVIAACTKESVQNDPYAEQFNKKEYLERAVKAQEAYTAKVKDFISNNSRQPSGTEVDSIYVATYIKESVFVGWSPTMANYLAKRYNLKPKKPYIIVAYLPLGGPLVNGGDDYDCLYTDQPCYYRATKYHYDIFDNATGEYLFSGSVYPGVYIGWGEWELKGNKFWEKYYDLKFTKAVTPEGVEIDISGIKDFTFYTRRVPK